MTYSDVVGGGLILPRKPKFTKRDVDSVVVNSLFTGGPTFSRREAKFIVRCSAIYHDVEYSRACENHPTDTLHAWKPSP